MEKRLNYLHLDSKLTHTNPSNHARNNRQLGIPPFKKKKKKTKQKFKRESTLSCFEKKINQSMTTLLA